MSRKIKTVGDLRQILSDTISGVLDGSVNADKANSVVKLAGQVNASLLAEVDAARMMLVAKMQAPPLGELPIGGSVQLIEQSSKEIAP